MRNRSILLFLGAFLFLVGYLGSNKGQAQTCACTQTGASCFDVTNNSGGPADVGSLPYAISMANQSGAAAVIRFCSLPLAQNVITLQATTFVQPTVPITFDATTFSGYPTNKVTLNIDNGASGLSIQPSNQIASLTLNGFKFIATNHTDAFTLLTISNVASLYLSNVDIAVPSNTTGSLNNVGTYLHHCSIVQIDHCNFNNGSTEHNSVAPLDLENITSVFITNSVIAGGPVNQIPLVLKNVDFSSIRSTLFANNKCIGVTIQDPDDDGILEESPVFYALDNTHTTLSQTPTWNGNMMKSTGVLCGNGTSGQVIDVYQMSTKTNCSLLEVGSVAYLGSTTVGTNGIWTMDQNALAPGTKINTSGTTCYAVTGTIANQTSGYSWLYFPPCPSIQFDNVNICHFTDEIDLNVGFNNVFPEAITLSGPGIVSSADYDDYFFDPTGLNGAIPLTASTPLAYTGCNSLQGSIYVNNPTISGLPIEFCPGTTGIVSLQTAPSGGTLTGPGVSGNTFNPASTAVKPGTNTLTYTVGSCSSTVQTYVYEQPPQLSGVLSATSVTFSDVWPLNHTQAGTDITSDVISVFDNDFIAATHKGVWRSEETYTYVDNRSQTLDDQSNVRLSTNTAFVTTSKPVSGTFGNMAMFDWSSTAMNACFPNWRKMNTTTKNSPLGFETEEKDVINRYSAALYGYDGKLAVAQAVNAQQNEIAFEGFEEYPNGNSIDDAFDLKGNQLVFFTKTPTTNLPTNYAEFSIVSANGNKIRVLGILGQTWVGKAVKVFGANLSQDGTHSSFNEKNIYGTFNVQTVTTDPQDATMTQVVLTTSDNSAFPFSGFWKGKLSAYIAPASPVYTSVNNEVSIIQGTAHTGSRSLRLNASAAWQQTFLQLQAGKQYLISAWVHAVAPGATFQSSASETTKRGLLMEFVNSTGTNTFSDLVEPSGNVINGWQKIEGTFTMPSNASTSQAILHVQVPANQTDFYDDLRIHPLNASMQSYVYDLDNLKIKAALDANNYASFYYYDPAGNLFLTKKETERGIMTIQESFSHQAER